MLAELHLTEDAFALHLLLQRPEGLVDIVVTDENLHVVFLFNPTVDRPNSRGAWTLGARIGATLSILTRKFPSAEPIQHLAVYR